MDFEELGKPGLGSQLCHLLVLCSWAKHFYSELIVFTCKREMITYSRALLCGFIEIMHGKGLVKGLHIVMSGS